MIDLQSFTWIFLLHGGYCTLQYFTCFLPLVQMNLKDAQIDHIWRLKTRHFILQQNTLYWFSTAINSRNIAMAKGMSHVRRKWILIKLLRFAVIYALCLIALMVLIFLLKIWVPE